MVAKDALAAALGDHRAGRLELAERAYRAILVQEPQNADALHLLGVVAHQRGDHREALRLIGAAVAAAPSHTAAQFNLAGVLDATGDDAGAVAAYERVLVLAPDNVDALVNLGNGLRKLDRLDEALQAYDRALIRAPGSALALMNKGTALAEAGRFDEGAVLLERAIEAGADPATAYRNLADVLRRARRYAEAERACRRALEDGERADAHLVLGQILEQSGRMAGALIEYRNALRLDPGSADACVNLAAHYYITGDVSRAIAYARCALARDPDSVHAHFTLGISLLAAGRMREGWPEFEWRVRERTSAGDFPYERYERWTGGRFDGRRLLVSKEQGLGDLLFLARYFPLVARQGGETIVETPSELRGLFERIGGITVYDASGGIFPLREDDLVCPAFSLPLALRTDAASIPADVPFLRADEAKAARWTERLNLRATDLNVGIVWSGGDRHRLDYLRSCSLREFAPLLEIEGVRWFGLQKGARENDELEWPPALRIERLGGAIEDFDDTAAIVARLDLVIGVDTSVAHLAGTLGKPVWMALGLGSDWRWMRDRTDTPWYPTMRLFRQHEPGRWEGAFQDVSLALRRLVSERNR